MRYSIGRRFEPPAARFLDLTILNFANAILAFVRSCHDFSEILKYDNYHPNSIKSQRFVFGGPSGARTLHRSIMSRLLSPGKLLAHPID